MDNASIHTKKEVPEWCAKNDVPITWNTPYRPDLMGIEFFWREAKQRYRRELTEHYVGSRHIDNLKLVKDVCRSVTDENAKKWALLGWQHLYNAELEPATPSLGITDCGLKDLYADKVLAGAEPSKVNLATLNLTDQRKVYVRVVFTCPLIKPKKKQPWEEDDSEWSPHKEIANLSNY